MTDTVASTGVAALGVVLILREILPYVFKVKVPQQCRFVDPGPEISRFRSMEISTAVAEHLKPMIQDQTGILRDIRDGVRDLKP